MHEVLQLALARRITYRAVERMIHEVELEGALARLARLLALGQNDVALHHRRNAGGGQLGRALHFDQAHAAHGRRGEGGMIAVMRDADAHLLGGFDDARALGHGHRGTVDRAVDQFLLAHTTATARALHTPSRICDRYSSLNFLMELAVGAAAESLNTQIVVPDMFLPRSSNASRSASLPSPSSIRRRILAIHAVPSRHGVHWPHDSCA